MSESEYFLVRGTADGLRLSSSETVGQAVKACGHANTIQGILEAARQ